MTKNVLIAEGKLSLGSTTGNEHWTEWESIMVRPAIGKDTILLRCRLDAPIAMYLREGAGKNVKIYYSVCQLNKDVQTTIIYAIQIENKVDFDRGPSMDRAKKICDSTVKQMSFLGITQIGMGVALSCTFFLAIIGLPVIYMGWKTIKAAKQNKIGFDSILNSAEFEHYYQPHRLGVAQGA